MENKTATATKKVKETLDKENFDNISDSTESLKNKVVQKVGETKEKITENLSAAAGKFHETSDKAQEILEDKAGNLNEYARQAIDKANQIGHRAADALNSSSEYINDFDFEKTKQQVVETIKEKPQIGFAIAGFFGLIIGLLLGRKTKKTV